jgi:hypothetical protein
MTIEEAGGEKPCLETMRCAVSPGYKELVEGNGRAHRCSVAPPPSLALPVAGVGTEPGDVSVHLHIHAATRAEPEVAEHPGEGPVRCHRLQELLIRPSTPPPHGPKGTNRV